MGLGTRLDEIHIKARQHVWLGYFAIFCRFALAAGFIPSGMQKVLGERFTTLAVDHPMGNYLEAFHQTGFYYPFVGVMQVLAAILLLIPRTVTLGAFIYLPIILNICILSLAVRFDGSQVTSPLMVLAVLYLLAWDYHKFKHIFPFHNDAAKAQLPPREAWTKAFPVKFFASVVGIVAFVSLHTRIFYDIMPRNTLQDCQSQCADYSESSCDDFCACIHKEGKPLEACLEAFENRTP